MITIHKPNDLPEAWKKHLFLLHMHVSTWAFAFPAPEMVSAARSTMALLNQNLCLLLKIPGTNQGKCKHRA